MQYGYRLYFFFELDIINQIQYLFKCKHLADVLDKVFQHRNTDTNIITDITDGSEYKSEFSEYWQKTI